MAAPVWTPGTLYPNGAIVQPASAPPVVSSVIPNPNFESGDTDWTKSGGAVIQNTGGFSGPWCAFVSGTSGRVLMQTGAPVVPGQSVTASVMGSMPVGSGGTSFDCVLVWYDASDVLISSSEGVELTRAQGSGWRQSTTTAVAPAGAAFVRVGADGNVASGGEIYLDNFTWNYSGPSVLEGLVYRAVQDGVGTSASTEPTWPLTLGVQVNDGTVIWEAVAATRVVWQATPLFRTGATEPTWPTTPGETVADGTLVWEAVTRRVTDPNCPNNAATIILASHVFNEDGDIVRFCAVNNALDWTSESNAGFLPSGMQGQNANDARVLADYRKNLGVLNASSFQLWQADPDPEVMDLLDMKNGFGSIYPRAATSVGDDLFVLCAEGVRNITQAAGNNSNTAGAVGAPIDDLVLAKMAELANNSDVVSAYYPGLGQYLVAFPEYPLQASGSLPASYKDATIQPYSYQAAGGRAPYVFSISDGALPTGLAMDSSGEVTGTPTVAGTFSWTVQVVDDAGDIVHLVEGAGGTYSVGIPAPVLVSNTSSFGGTPDNLIVGAPFTVPSGSGAPVISVSSDGIYAAFARSTDNGSNRFGWKKWNTSTEAWDVLANPSTMPVLGPTGLAWSNDGRFLACGISASSPFSSMIYERVNDTLVLVPQTVTLPNLGYFVAWSPDDSMIAFGNGVSNKGLCLFDVADGVLSNLRFNTDNVGPGMQPAFSPDGQFVVGATRDAGIYVYSVANSPLTLIDSAGSAEPTAWSGCHWVDGGIITVSDQGSPGFSFIKMYTFDGANLVFAGSPPVQPPSTVQGSSVTSDGLYLATANSTAETIHVYDLSNFAAAALVDTVSVSGVQEVSWGPQPPTPTPDPPLIPTGTTETFVATKMTGGGWSWSRYVFPFAITDFALYENDLYFRHGDHISLFDKALTHDELDATGAEDPVPFAGRVQWNWLDMGATGSTKHLQAFDLIATGATSVSFGYNERQKDTAWTDPYTIDADTLPDGPIQYEVTAPSISVRIDFAAGTAWSLSSFIAYVDDLGPNV